MVASHLAFLMAFFDKKKVSVSLEKYLASASSALKHLNFTELTGHILNK